MMHRIVQTMEMAPGCCCYCRGGAVPALDLDIERDDIGQALERQYLCANCVRDLAAYYCEQVPTANFRVFRTELLAEQDAAVAADKRAIEMLTERAIAAEEALAAIERANAARLLQAAEVVEQPELAPALSGTADVLDALGPEPAARKRTKA